MTKDTKFTAGKSGNPKGRPPGLSDTRFLRAAIAAHIPAIVDQLVARATAGDVQAARLLLERVLPPVKASEEPVKVAMLPNASLTDQGKAIMAAIGAGDLTPSQGAAMLAGLASVAKLAEIDDLAARIAELEKNHART